MMAVSSVSRKITRKTGTEIKFDAMVLGEGREKGGSFVRSPPGTNEASKMNRKEKGRKKQVIK
jgi:hypothetical protein